MVSFRALERRGEHCLVARSTHRAGFFRCDEGVEEAPAAEGPAGQRFWGEKGKLELPEGRGGAGEACRFECTILSKTSGAQGALRGFGEISASEV